MSPKDNQKKITTLDELAVMINSDFQSNQEYMDKGFDDMDKKIYQGNKDLKMEISKVGKKLDEFIGDYKSEKLPMRVESLENLLNLHKK